jgi:hypothetical protein
MRDGAKSGWCARRSATWGLATLTFAFLALLAPAHLSAAAHRRAVSPIPACEAGKQLRSVVVDQNHDGFAESASFSRCVDPIHTLIFQSRTYYRSCIDPLGFCDEHYDYLAAEDSLGVALVPFDTSRIAFLAAASAPDEAVPGVGVEAVSGDLSWSVIWFVTHGPPPFVSPPEPLNP